MRTVGSEAAGIVGEPTGTEVVARPKLPVFYDRENNRWRTAKLRSDNDLFHTFFPVVADGVADVLRGVEVSACEQIVVICISLRLYPSLATHNAG
jgi:hypothetical protein